MMFSIPSRGSVYLVRFDPTMGHEIKKTRPAVVISNDHMNELSNTVLVLPITTGLFPYYHLIPLYPPEGGLKQPSSIVTEQIRSIDKERIQSYLGVINQRTLAKIEDTLRDHFGLPESHVINF